MPREIGFLLMVLVLGIVGRNHLVWTASLILLAIRVCRLDFLYPALEDWGVRAGLTLLVLAIMVPFVSGSIRFEGLWNTLRTPPGLLAAVTGAVAAYLGKLGVDGMRTYPEIVVGLVVGSILGASLLRGVPTGPLIAAGAAALLLQVLGFGR